MTTFLLGLALLSAAPPTPPVDPAPQTPPAAAALSAEAVRFGQLYVPLDLGLETAMAGFDREFEPTIRKDANVVALDARFSGLIEAAGVAGRAAMLTSLRRELPGVQQRVAAFAAQRMTGAELADANAYLASPAGRNLQRTMAQTADTSALKQEMAGTAVVPKMDGDKLMAMMSPAALAQLSPDDLKSLIAFGGTPGGRKFNASSKVFADHVANEMNRIIARMQPDIEQAVIAAITGHIGKK